MLSNTAKHFTCYSLLITVGLFLFGLYHKVELQYTSSQQKIVDNVAATQEAATEAQKAIAVRDQQLQLTNSQLDKQRADAKTLSEQIALVSQYLQGIASTDEGIEIPPYTTINMRDSPGILTSRPNPSIDADVIVPAKTFSDLTTKVVSCEKCSNSLAVSEANVTSLQIVDNKQAATISAYEFIESKEPHTKFQKFRKGLRWVFLLGH